MDKVLYEGFIGFKGTPITLWEAGEGYLFAVGSRVDRITEEDFEVLKELIQAKDQHEEYKFQQKINSARKREI